MQEIATKSIAARAWKEALGEVRLDTPVRLVTGIGTPFVSAGAVWWFTGSIAWAGIAGLGFVVIVLLAVFIVKMFAVPIAIARDGATENEGLGTQIAELEQRILVLTAPPPPPDRGPDAIYQHGDEVGGVVGARRIPSSSIFWFDQINHQGRFDPNAEFEYREWVLLKQSVQAMTNAKMAGAIHAAVIGVEAMILRKRDNA
jgi:hypothetical protein